MNISVAKSLYMVYLGITFASIYLLYPLFYPPNTLMQLFSSIVILAKCSRMQKLHPTDFKTRGFRLSESVKKNYAPQISRFGPKLALGHRTMPEEGKQVLLQRLSTGEEGKTSDQKLNLNKLK